MATAEETLTGLLAAQAADAAIPAEAAPDCVRNADAPDWMPWLLRVHLRRVFSVLYRITGNRADAEDLAQEVFLRAHLRRHQLRNPERALPWLLRIASNAAIDFRRARGAEKLNEPWDHQPHPSAGATPEQQLLRNEREERLRRALAVLSPKERAAIVMRDLEELSGAEVARALGCSEITVRTHIASARGKLRRYFAKGPAV